VRGHEFFKDGVLDFGLNPNTLDCTYRTVFGPSVPHTGVIYADNDANVAHAIWRLCGKRVPDQPGEHERLRANQGRFVSEHLDAFDKLGKLYEPHFPAYYDIVDQCEMHVTDPHPKRELREDAWRELCESGTAFQQDTWLQSQRVRWKMKRDEWAKNGKKPRMIADLGVGASLRGFRLTEFLKRAQSAEEFNYKGGTMVFCKSPDPVKLKEYFQRLIDPPGRFFFLYFSDDACLSYRLNGKVLFHNLDISSCDASHTGALFNLLLRIVPSYYRSEMSLLIRQCASLLRIVSRADPLRKVDLLPNEPKLYSGSTLTTAINNLANLCIAMSIADLPEIRPDLIAHAAALAGYIVTGCEPLETVEDIQFLKHSPVFSDAEEWEPLLNFGVFLRASGVCRGDLPGSKAKSFLERASAFQAALFHGAYPYVKSHLFKLLEDRYHVVSDIAIPKSLIETSRKVVKNPLSQFSFQTESFMRRYRLTAYEYDQLVEFASYGTGFSCAFPALGVILQKDYSLSLNATTERVTLPDPRCTPHLHSSRR